MKLNALKDLKRSLEKKGNPDVIFLEDDKQHRLRLVPNLQAKDSQFVGVWLHYRGGGIVPETMFSPKNWGETDPIEDFVRVYLAKGRVSKAKYKQLKNMEPTEAFITTAVIRGKESEGTKLLVLTTGQFNQIFSEIEVATSEDPNINIVHPVKGYDFIVNVVSREKSEKGMREFKIKLARSSSVLTDDKELLKNLLEEQPSWESAYKRPSVEDLARYHKSMAEMNTSDLDSADDDDDDDVDSEETDNYDVQDFSAGKSEPEDDVNEEDLTSEFEEFMRSKKAQHAGATATVGGDDDDDDLPF